MSSDSDQPGEPTRPTGAPARPGGDIPTPRGRRKLERPPGERLAERTAVVPESAPDLRGAIAIGLGAALATAVSVGLLGGLLDVTLGLVAVGLGGGWLVGRSVLAGAWPGAPSGPAAAAHRSRIQLRVLALVLAAAAIAFGLVLHWLVALMALPEATTSILERLVSLPLPAWLEPQLYRLGPSYLFAALAAAMLAWRASR